MVDDDKRSPERIPTLVTGKAKDTPTMVTGSPVDRYQPFTPITKKDKDLFDFYENQVKHIRSRGGLKHVGNFSFPLVNAVTSATFDFAKSGGETAANAYLFALSRAGEACGSEFNETIFSSLNMIARLHGTDVLKYHVSNASNQVDVSVDDFVDAINNPIPKKKLTEYRRRSVQENVSLINDQKELGNKKAVGAFLCGLLLAGAGAVGYMIMNPNVTTVAPTPTYAQGDQWIDVDGNSKNKTEPDVLVLSAIECINEQYADALKPKPTPVVKRQCTLAEVLNSGAPTRTLYDGRNWVGDPDARGEKTVAKQIYDANKLRAELRQSKHEIDRLKSICAADYTFTGSTSKPE